MVRINGIKEFMSLREEQQSDILRGLKFKERLFSFLENRQSKEVKEKRQVDCKHCCGSGKILLEPRNNADIHASQIHLCPRKLWFDLKGYGNKYSQKPAPQLQLIFDHGTKLHDMLQEYGMQGAWKSYSCSNRTKPIFAISCRLNSSSRPGTSSHLTKYGTKSRFSG